MSEEEIFEKVKEIIIEHLGIEEDRITKTATLAEDLAADSLDVVEVVMEIEDTFKIEIPDDDAEKIPTVGAVVQYIKERI